MDVEGLVGPVVEAAGLELVEAALHRDGGQRVLRVTVDREGGVDLSAISDLSERISRRLDLMGFDPGPYSLEVTSPGVERPLREPHEFSRRVGDRVKVKTVRPIEGSRTVTGRLVRADANEVRIATEAGERAVPFEDIASARTVVDWDEELARNTGTKRTEGGRR